MASAGMVCLEDSIQGQDYREKVGSGRDEVSSSRSKVAATHRSVEMVGLQRWEWLSSYLMPDLAKKKLHQSSMLDI